MPTTNAGVYAHSGRMGAGALLVPVGALVAALALSAAYAYACAYSPLAGWISVVLVGLFAGGIGWTVAKLGHAMRCRSRGYLHVVGFLVGAVALYASWAVFEYAMLRRFDETFTASLQEVLLTPVGVWELAKLINVDGWYEISGYTPKGQVLWVLWAIEGAIVVLGASVLATHGMDETVFCESCGRWCRKDEGAVLLGMPKSDEVLSRLAPDRLAALDGLPVVDASANPHLRVDFWECDRCGDTNAMQIKVVRQEPGARGKVETEVTDFTDIWCVTPDDLARVSAPRAGEAAPAKPRKRPERTKATIA